MGLMYALKFACGEPAIISVYSCCIHPSQIEYITLHPDIVSSKIGFEAHASSFQSRLRPGPLLLP